MPLPGQKLTFAGAKPDDDADSRLEPEFRAHWATYKSDPSPTNAGKLVTLAKPILTSGVRAYGGADAGQSLNSKAKVIAAGALKSYDPKRGTLKNHLLTNLQGLQRHAAKQGQLLSVPERVAIDRQRVDSAETELRDLNGRDPSTSEVADHISLPHARIAYVRKYRPGFTEGQSAAMVRSDDGDEGGEPAVMGSSPRSAWINYMYPDLDPIDQVIAEHGFGLHGRQPRSTGHIAKLLNLTPGAVSQRASRIQASLDDLVANGGL